MLTFGIDAGMIRYGGDNVAPVVPNDELVAKYPFLIDEYYVSVSRAQSDNNLHVVLEAFAKMPDKKLVLVSNFKKSTYGVELYEKYKDFENMYLINGVYEKTEINAIRFNARAYIHSHSRCGTPPSLCEAMYLGRPIISYDAEVNHELTEDHALFFQDADELVNVVNNLTEDTLSNLSEYSIDISHRKYTWEYISKEYSKVFDA